MSLYSRAPLAGLVSNVLDPDKPRRVHGQPEFRRYLQHTSAFRQCVCVCVCVRACVYVRARVCVCVCAVINDWPHIWLEKVLQEVQALVCGAISCSE